MWLLLLSLNFWLNRLFGFFNWLWLAALCPVLLQLAFENDLVTLFAPCVDPGALDLMHSKLSCIDFLVTGLAKFHFS